MMNKTTRLTTYAILLSLSAVSVQARAPGAPGAPADTLGRFPKIEGTNLEGRRFVLPGDFEGSLNVVMVAFKREQQRDVDTWLPFLKTVAAARPDVRVYEIPTLGRRYRIMRSFIDGGMRSGIPDKAVREATITLYIDKTPFRDALKIGTEDRIQVFLIDRQGRVHWHAEGPLDAKAGSSLEARLAMSTSVEPPALSLSSSSCSPSPSWSSVLLLAGGPRPRSAPQLCLRTSKFTTLAWL